MNKEKREFSAWWVLVTGLLLVSVVAFGVLAHIGVFTRTAVERKVFENSFQYDQARKAEIATYQAQLVELERQLSNPQTNTRTRSQIETQMAAIRIQLATARGRQI